MKDKKGNDHRFRQRIPAAVKGQEALLMPEKLMLPIGEEYFSSIRRNGFYYVDKTKMIPDLMRSRGLVNLFTRPRRFGKSLNMDMFKCFLEIGTDRSLFEGLSVMEDREVCAAHMGQYPVISISLKDAEGGSYENALDGLSEILREEARNHEYLLGSERLCENDKAVLKEFYVAHLDEKAQRAFLRLFSQMLFAHHGRKIVLLIDEYDVPLDKAWQDGYYEKMVRHIRAMFSRALKTNPFLDFAIITGCLRIARESIFTGINNFKINTISEDRFAQYFGFTESEVRDLLSYYCMPEKYDLFKEWYDGYRFGKKEIYCPWDVINQADRFLDAPDAPMESYWANSSSNYIVRDLLKNPSEAVRADIEKLISGEAVTKTILPELTYADLSDTDRKLRQTFLWSVLYATGYLTDEKTAVGGTEKKAPFSAKTRRLVIPNREVQEIYESQIRSWFERGVSGRKKEWEELRAALMAGDAKKVRESLDFFLARSISIRDTAVRKKYKENFYHGLLLGLLETSEDWTVQSNVESGIGYLDIEILSWSRKTGCVIEVKYAEDGEYDAALAEAMKQIEDSGYTDDLRREDMETIYKYGIAFYKKSCRVRCEKA